MNCGNKCTTFGSGSTPVYISQAELLGALPAREQPKSDDSNVNVFGDTTTQAANCFAPEAFNADVPRQRLRAYTIPVSATPTHNVVKIARPGDVSNRRGHMAGAQTGRLRAYTTGYAPREGAMGHEPYSRRQSFDLLRSLVGRSGRRYEMHTDEYITKNRAFTMGQQGKFEKRKVVPPLQAPTKPDEEVGTQV